MRITGAFLYLGMDGILKMDPWLRVHHIHVLLLLKMQEQMPGYIQGQLCSADLSSMVGCALAQHMGMKHD